STTGPIPGCGSFSSGTTNDLWYSFTVPAGTNTMAFHAFNSDVIPMLNASAPGMAVYSGTDCSNLTLLDCFESSGGFMQNAEIHWENISGLTPGETIYIRIWDENNLAQQLFIAASVRLDFPEDECVSAVPMSQGGCNILATPGPVQAPEDCGWNTSDNTIFYHFTVTASDSQPYTIEAENGECVSNAGGLSDSEIQLAVWSWDGSSCADVGGSPYSDPANNSGTYYGCANGTGTVTYSENLPPGEYILAMDGFSDLNGTSLCTYGFSAPFIEEDLVVDLTTTDAICGESGSASISVSLSCSGTLNYNWSTGDTSSSVSGLLAGSYSVTVTDDAPCGDTVIDFDIVDNGDISVDVTTVGNTCSGPFDATAEVTGADPALCDFVWNTTPAETTQTVTGLTPGTYTVTVTFGTCQDTETIDVQYSNVEFDLTYDTGVCAGATAQAHVEPTEGESPFTYAWTTGDDTQTITINTSGSYTVTVMDDLGCTATESFTVNVFPAVDIDADVTDNECYGQAEGEIDVSVSSGTPPFDFSWNSGDTTEDVSYLDQGTYSLTVIDDHGCSTSDSWDITMPSQLSYTFNNDTSICEGAERVLHIVATGGTPPYDYHWDGIAGYNEDNLTVSPDTTSIFTVSVTDANGCTTQSQSAEIVVSPYLGLDVDVSDCLCYDACDGEAVATVTGGILPYTYSWESDNNHNGNICAGTYELTVTDAIGCSISEMYYISQPNPLVYNLYSEPATCSYTEDGLSWIALQGGTPPYNYLWDNGELGDSVNVGGGMHGVTVTDAHGCVLELTNYVSAPDPIIISDVYNRQICINEAVSFHPAATGGSGEYDFRYSINGDTIWNNRSITLDTLTQTTDIVLTVRDMNGCTAKKEFTVFVYPELNIVSCHVDQDTICVGDPVKLYTDVNGGNGGPYQVYLNRNNIIPSPYTFYPTESGYYHVKVNDMCSTPAVRDSVYIHVWPLPQNNFTADVVEGCSPLTVHFNVTTGSEFSEFEWNFGDEHFTFQRNPVHVFRRSGNHTISLKITDEHGCVTVRDKVNMIRVFPLPVLDFYTKPDEIDMMNPQVTFHPITENTDSLYWYFGDGDSVHNSVTQVTHLYDGIGEYTVSLVGQSIYNCMDTVSKVVKIDDRYSFYAPTAFTPNRDGFNDCFSVCGHGIDPNEFSLRIYNRWGELVFETTEYDHSEGCDGCTEGSWDGTYQGNLLKGDRVLDQGIYGWVCTFKDRTGIDNEYNGVVRLIR
ncbi:MAG: PKD domain-containing protein, partial [Candidatus Delongbacteria bacterium]|nr:PKD domain-containing protein [Candidatus Delongbacteria bacterium]